ncbi:MAG: sel1 repeat family protein [Proteobacteria bacterium]|nr:sel1 repeat family protein [Pseudomonadota bacterium]
MATSPGIAAQRSLALWEQAPAEGCGIAFEAPLRRCRLDYSPDSLARIDAFLGALRRARGPQAAEFIAVPAQQQLLGFLCFYAGEVLGRALDQPPLWLRGDQALRLAPDALTTVPPLERAFCARFGAQHARDGASLFLPMTGLCGRLFAAEDVNAPGLADAAARWWPAALGDAASRAAPLPPRPGQPWPPGLPDAQPADAAPAAAVALAPTGDADPDALYRQALRLLRGEGVAKDPVQARTLWRRAAAQGHAPSQHALGLALARGQGGDADLPGALDQFRRAAEQGLLEAQLQAAQLHLRHDGPAPDLLEAERWLRQAAAQGSDKARELIAALGFDDAPPPTLGERIDGWTDRLIDRVVDGIADFSEARRARRRS